MLRIAQYQEAAGKVAGAASTAPIAKTASEGDFEKFAAENPEIVREAHDLGYMAAKQELQKLAEAAYVKSYNATVENIYKFACDSFVNGFAETVKLLEAKAI